MHRYLWLSFFADFYDVYYGHCFSFNPNGTLNSTKAGSANGLRVQARVDVADYLPWIDAAGIAVALTEAVSLNWGGLILLRFLNQ